MDRYIQVDLPVPNGLLISIVQKGIRPSRVSSVGNILKGFPLTLNSITLIEMSQVKLSSRGPVTCVSDQRETNRFSAKGGFQRTEKGVLQWNSFEGFLYYERGGPHHDEIDP